MSLDMREPKRPRSPSPPHISCLESPTLVIDHTCITPSFVLKQVSEQGPPGLFAYVSNGKKNGDLSRGTAMQEKETDRILPQAGLPGNQTLTQRSACSRLTGQKAQNELLPDREGSRLGRGRRRAVIQLQQRPQSIYRELRSWKGHKKTLQIG